MIENDCQCHIPSYLVLDTLYERKLQWKPCSYYEKAPKFGENVDASQ